MTRSNYIFTSESVSEGHPDKVCDRISDAVLDTFLTEEPEARVAAETFATTNRIVIGGEVGLSDKEKLSHHMGKIEQIARDCIKDIGYEQDKFHWKTVEVTNLLHEQSAHIAQGVDAGANKDEGAGDQGIMFGYATTETPELMPAPIQYSHAILRRLAQARKDGSAPDLGPDAKSQLSLRYENGKPVEIMSIVLSTQHRSADQDSAYIRSIVEPYIREVVPGRLDHRQNRMVGQSNWYFRDWWPGRRCRFDGAQDYSRYLWRCRATWRRRVFGQGSHQSGPFGGLCGALFGQKYRRGRYGGTLLPAIVLCHWRL